MDGRSAPGVRILSGAPGRRDHARTPAFVWVYPWWGALPVFATVYVPFFVVSMYSYDWRPRTQARVIGGLFALYALLLAVFAGLLRWI